jgi:hypothetical protein
MAVNLSAIPKTSNSNPYIYIEKNTRKRRVRDPKNLTHINTPEKRLNLFNSLELKTIQKTILWAGKTKVRLFHSFVWR